MIADCVDCGKTKKGCKIITQITNTFWMDNIKRAEESFLNKPVCRACLNFSKKLDADFGPGKGFYDVLESSPNSTV